MSKTAIIIAMLFPSTLFAAISVVTPSAQTQQSEQSQTGSVIRTQGTGVFDQLSMGPDPGGKSGDTVTPTTSKTGQPSADGAGASNQSGASSTAAPTGGSGTLKQQRDSSDKRQNDTTGTASTSSSTSGKPGNNR